MRTEKFYFTEKQFAYLKQFLDTFALWKYSTEVVEMDYIQVSITYPVADRTNVHALLS